MALQEQYIYEKTTAQLLLNYHRAGTWENPQISKDTLAYRPITNENLSTWDAAIYNCLSQHGYRPVSNCYESFKASFFPAFPWFWRFTGLDFRGISLLNYFVFALIFYAGLRFFRCSASRRPWLFLLGLTFPSSLIFALPYSESLFLLFGLLTAWFWLRGQARLFAVFFTLLLLVRPAAFFFSLAALLVWALRAFYRGGVYPKGPLAQAALLAHFIAPATVFSLHYFQAGSLTAYFEATEVHQSFFKKPWPLSDWSHEGFALSSAAMGLLLIPAALGSLFVLFRPAFWQKKSRLRQLDAVALFYCGGLFFFWILQSGGSLHSLHRFIFASPAFFWLLLRAVAVQKKGLKIAYLLLALAIALLFVLGSAYGGHAFHLEYLGLVFIFLNLSFWLFLPQRFGASAKLAMLLLLLMQVWWTTYLHNQLLSNAWIFT